MQAEAILAKDTAELENAKVEEARYKRLLDREFVAREQYDQIVTKGRTLTATIDADRAAIETAKALVRADQAAVENWVVPTRRSAPDRRPYWHSSAAGQCRRPTTGIRWW
jgi:multidrug resistance efflux pump